jgi:hypothetical protein
MVVPPDGAFPLLLETLVAEHLFQVLSASLMLVADISRQEQPDLGPEVTDSMSQGGVSFSLR